MWVMFQHKTYSPVNSQIKQHQKTTSQTWIAYNPPCSLVFFIFCKTVQPPLGIWSKRQISNYLCDAPGDIKERPYYRSARIKGSRACDCDKGLVEAHFWNSLRLAKFCLGNWGSRSPSMCCFCSVTRWDTNPPNPASNNHPKGGYHRFEQIWTPN